MKKTQQNIPHSPLADAYRLYQEQFGAPVHFRVLCTSVALYGTGKQVVQAMRNAIETDQPIEDWETLMDPHWRSRAKVIWD